MLCEEWGVSGSGLSLVGQYKERRAGKLSELI